MGIFDTTVAASFSSTPNIAWILSSSACSSDILRPASGAAGGAVCSEDLHRWPLQNVGPARRFRHEMMLFLGIIGELVELPRLRVMGTDEIFVAVAAKDYHNRALLER